MVDNVYDIVEEDQAGISPKGLNLGNSSQMTGQGMFHAWLGVKPPSTASGTLGTNVAFNIIGRVQFVNGPWTPIQSNQFALSGWGSSAALSGSIIGFYPNFTFTVAAGTSASANPNVTITFPPGTWVDAVTGAVAPSPIYECKDVGGTAPISFITGEQTSTTTTSMMIQYDNNTPLTSGQTVQITCIGNAR